MNKKHNPLRKCAGCGEMKPKCALLRIVRMPDITDENMQILKKGEIIVDKTGKSNGRGVYVCRNEKCFNLARKARRFERSLSCKIPDEIFEELEKEICKEDAIL